MFRKITMVDELIRRGIRPKPIVCALPDISNDEDHGTTQKLSHLGQTARFKGDISLDENLCIDGEIEGTVTVRGKQLSINNKALVKGEIRARTVEVRGAVEGDIHGDELVHLHATATVTGNVHCKRIVVDDGARFDGSLKTSRDVTKLSDAKRTAKPLVVKDTVKPADSKPTLTSVNG
jgi:cytoskeletal protein CcmA (bactofilin family)